MYRGKAPAARAPRTLSIIAGRPVSGKSEMCRTIYEILAKDGGGEEVRNGVASVWPAGGMVGVRRHAARRSLASIDLPMNGHCCEWLLSVIHTSVRAAALSRTVSGDMFDHSLTFYDLPLPAPADRMERNLSRAEPQQPL